MSENGKKVPVVVGAAELSKWDIGPVKDSDCALTFTVVIKNWEDVATIRALAAGQVVVRVMPLQLSLPENVDCPHPAGARMSFAPNQAVCTECGLILDA